MTTTDEMFSEYALETVELFVHMDQYISKNFGTRCSDYERGCAVCDMWKMRNDMKEFVCD